MRIGIEVAFILIILFLIFLVCLPFSIGKLIPTDLERQESKWIIEKNADGKVIIIFGGTCELGKQLTHKLTEEGHNVILASRRATRAADMRIETKLSFDWIQCDTRLNREVEYVFTDVSERYGKIDAVINLAMINVNYNFLEIPMTCEKDGEDIFLKLPGAYKRAYKGSLMLYRRGAPGSEMGFFTNVIGAINISRIAIKHDVDLVIHQKIDDDIIVTALMKEMGKNNIGKSMIVLADPMEVFTLFDQTKR
jgi:NAD(P)-dependent dehydrogenase (short-subunit alcohol dehydrogenase family)